MTDQPARSVTVFVGWLFATASPSNDWTVVFDHDEVRAHGGTPTSISARSNGPQAMSSPYVSLPISYG